MEVMKRLWAEMIMQAWLNASSVDKQDFILPFFVGQRLLWAVLTRLCQPGYCFMIFNACFTMVANRALPANGGKELHFDDENPAQVNQQCEIRPTGLEREASGVKICTVNTFLFLNSSCGCFSVLSCWTRSLFLVCLDPFLHMHTGPIWCMLKICRRTSVLPTCRDLMHLSSLDFFHPVV